MYDTPPTYAHNLRAVCEDFMLLNPSYYKSDFRDEALRELTKREINAACRNHEAAQAPLFSIYDVDRIPSERGKFTLMLALQLGLRWDAFCSITRGNAWIGRDFNGNLRMYAYCQKYKTARRFEDLDNTVLALVHLPCTCATETNDPTIYQARWCAIHNQRYGGTEGLATIFPVTETQFQSLCAMVGTTGHGPRVVLVTGLRVILIIDFRRFERGFREALELYAGEAGINRSEIADVRVTHTMKLQAREKTKLNFDLRLFNRHAQWTDGSKLWFRYGSRAPAVLGFGFPPLLKLAESFERSEARVKELLDEVCCRTILRFQRERFQGVFEDDALGRTHNAGAEASAMTEAREAKKDERTLRTLMAIREHGAERVEGFIPIPKALDRESIHQNLAAVAGQPTTDVRQISLEDKTKEVSDKPRPSIPFLPEDLRRAGSMPGAAILTSKGRRKKSGDEERLE